MYDIELTDSVTSATMPPSEVPIKLTPLEGATDVETLDKNVYTSFVNQKRFIEHTWAYMTDEQYDAIKAFYDRQFTTYTYPRVTIPSLGISDLVVRMTLSPRTVIDNCGTVASVTVTFRETRQLAGS